MATTVYVFLPQFPTGKSYYKEFYPFGPDDVGDFNSDLAIEIDQSQLKTFGRCICAVNGLIRFIPGSLPIIGSLVLRPDAAVARDLAQTLGLGGAGPGNLVFVYRSLETDSVRDAVGRVIANQWPEFFRSSKYNADINTRAKDFAEGKFAVACLAGAEIGRGAAIGGKARLGFEIVWVPAGLGPVLSVAYPDPPGWKRLLELIAADETRRLDPMAFYAAIAASSGPAKLVAGDAKHTLFSITTRRVLLEMRDEYDRPFKAPVSIKSGGTTSTKAPPAGSRGTFVVKSLKPGETAHALACQVSAPNHVLTRLPSGPKAEVAPSLTLTPPAHAAFQAIYMNLSPTAAEEAKSWFAANTSPRPRYTSGNKVTSIRDGIEVFRQYTEAIRTLTGAGHYMELAAWWLTDSFELVHGDKGSTFAALTTAAANRGAQVRALLWDNVKTQNTAEAKNINKLPSGRGQAILDNKTLNLGAQHQKLLVINGSQGAFAFCGGVDINPDRCDSPRHGAIGPFHDVHARVDGPAVGDIHRAFVDRWNDHKPSSMAVTAPPFKPDAGSAYVQVACTYPPKKKYSFASSGSLTPLHAVIRAVSRAQKYIYFEDQYFVAYPGTDWLTGGGDTVGLLTALRAALKRIDYLIVVIGNHADLPQCRYRRQLFIKSLRQVAADKVHVFYLGRKIPITPLAAETATSGGGDNSSGGKNYRNEIYVHSKVWMVDDVIAKIGSANCSRRGYTHESEMDLVIVDGALQDGARAFCRRFRTELWGEHLNLSGAKSVLLEDYKAALTYWLKPPPGAHIRPYLHDAEASSGTDYAWGKTWDCDGR